MTNSLSPLTYKEAGVDIDAGDQLVENIKPFAKRTMRPEVLGGIGGFGALVEVSKKYKNPVMVSGTDGVGTKLKLAFTLKKHDTVGIARAACGIHAVRHAHGAPMPECECTGCRRHRGQHRHQPCGSAHLRHRRIVSRGAQ